VPTGPSAVVLAAAREERGAHRREGGEVALSRRAWILAAALVAVALVLAIERGARGVREGRGGLAWARLKSPMPYLFAGYLLVAGLVSPTTPGESSSPLLWLALIVPLAYAAATFSAIGSARPSRALALVLALVHGAGFLAASAMVLAIASPRFVPEWLR
jgi:hypothetical protein